MDESEREAYRKVAQGPIHDIHEVSWYGDVKEGNQERQDSILVAISMLAAYIIRVNMETGCFYSAALTMMVEFSRRSMEERKSPDLIDDTIRDLEAITAELKRNREEVRAQLAKEKGTNDTECLHPINAGT